MRISTEIIQQAIRNTGASVRFATINDAFLLEQDLSESDQYELSSTWRQNWRHELHATFENAQEAFIVSLENIPGFITFGVTLDREYGQIWLLQSQSFSAGFKAAGGSVSRFMASTCAILEIFANRYELLFNFIPKTQHEVIRWLKLCGFIFLDFDEKIWLFFHQSTEVNINEKRAFFEAYQ